MDKESKDQIRIQVFNIPHEDQNNHASILYSTRMHDYFSLAPLVSLTSCLHVIRYIL